MQPKAGAQAQRISTRCRGTATALVTGLACGILLGFPLRASALDVLCGDANSDTSITSADALFTLRAAVGSRLCWLPRCDYNGDNKLTASDALSILRKAVGQNVASHCPSMPTTSLTWDEGAWDQVLWD